MPRLPALPSAPTSHVPGNHVLGSDGPGPHLPAAHAPSWPMYHRVWRRAELLDRMIGALERDVLGAVSLDGGQAYFDARSTCLSCARAPECRSMLDVQPHPKGPPDFCPNSFYFDRCTTIRNRLRNAPALPHDGN